MSHFDVVIIGAGAAGLMCAATAGQRGRSVLVADHATKVGKKILVSGGGRCNFTNLDSGPEHFLSQNPHFPKSALARYTPWDFLALVSKHGIPYHEKKAGQLFCDHKSRAIRDLLLTECANGGVRVRTRFPVSVDAVGPPHRLTTPEGPITTDALVIATGGLSYARMGATGFGLDLARRLGLAIQPPRPALVPLVLAEDERTALADLAGVAIDAEVCTGGTCFREDLLFTHKGLSGPAVLQASSYWSEGVPVHVDLLPGFDVTELVAEARSARPGMALRTLLAEYLPRSLARRWAELWLPDKPLAQLGGADLERIREELHRWTVVAAGTEGFETAEVTAGGIDTAELDSRTMAAKRYLGLYFIGEVVDVTGHLGGHNFQWAWASGYAAGEAV